MLPVGTAEPPGPDALALLPLVGAAVGGLSGTAGWAVAQVAPHALAVAVAFGASIVLTGALHVDGFLDACDGLFARVNPERRLAIMRDPHHGTFAMAFFAVLCAAWLAALWDIPPQRLPLALAFAAATSRWSAVAVARLFPYGPGGTHARAFATGAAPGVHIAMGILVLVLGWAYWGHAVLLVAVGLITLAAASVLRRRLGGVMTGDVYGFLIACTEVAVLAGLTFTSP